MNKQKMKEMLQKNTIAYLFALVVIFVVVLVGVSNAGLKTLMLIVIAIVFAGLIFLQRKKGNPVKNEETPGIIQEKADKTVEDDRGVKAETKADSAAKAKAQPSVKEEPASTQAAKAKDEPAAKASTPAKKPAAKAKATPAKKTPAKTAPKDK